MINKIDVTIATKNNEDTIKKCIESIKKYIPYNNIIILDDSDDKTPKIAKELGAIVYKTPSLLGEKRYLQAKYSETEWIASIDSDVFIFENWWREMSKKTIKDVGLINGFLKSDFESLFPAYDKYTKFNTLNSYNKSGMRSTMANNLIRRELLLKSKKDLVNKNIHAGEDTIIAKKIKNLGYKTSIITTPTAYHYHKNAFQHHLMAYNRAGESRIKKDGFKGIIKLFTLFGDINIKWINYSYYSKSWDLTLYRYLVKLYLCFLKGGFGELIKYFKSSK